MCVLSGEIRHFPSVSADEAIEELDAQRIQHCLNLRSPECASKLLVLREVDSTNQFLLRHADTLPSGSVCLSDYQSAGRGRRGKKWVSPRCANIYLSMLWHSNLELNQLGGLSIGLGVGAIRTLQAVGVTGVGLKWPNDLLVAGRKIGGILVETDSIGGKVVVVSGIGINFKMHDDLGQEIDQPWTDMHAVVGGGISRNCMVALLIQNLSDVMGVFEKEGVAAFVDEWRRADLLRGKEVNVYGVQNSIHGWVRGIDERGVLLLETHEGIVPILSGELSVREA